MKPMIKTGFCVSYDWPLLKKSLSRVYNDSDVICLSLDKERNTWSGNRFSFDENAFYDFCKEIDKDNKIFLFEGNFSLSNLSARENCNRQRMLMAEKLGKGGWHIQIDADEYFLDFSGFVKYLKSINAHPTGEEKPFNVLVNLVSLIKRVDGGYLYVDFLNNLPESAPFATTKPNYERARQNGHFNFVSPFYVIHETWAREEDSLWFKINNWGHSSEELLEVQKRKSYFELWKSLDKYNYSYVRNFHPAKAEVWPALAYQSGETVEEFILNFKAPKFPLSKAEIKIRNNRNVARLKSLIKKIKL